MAALSIWKLCILCLTFTNNYVRALATPAIRDNPRQDIVTWDKYSVLVNGERIMLLAGEFHPFRIPSPGLWLDIFQKVRALGYSAVSFYIDWALVEHEPGKIRTEGVFSLEQFFDAARQAGVYLIARPGPYINSEVSGGGLPGWLSRNPGRVRSADQQFLEAITPYILTVGKLIARAEITKGGPVILFQPENEYTMCAQVSGYTQFNNMSITGLDTSCLEAEYMAYVQEKYREAGITVPFMVNDAFPLGNFAPGSGLGAADIYSFDHYPLGWDAAPKNPADWSQLFHPLLLYNFSIHEQQSPGAPMSTSEFQGGCPDPWGGVGVETSAAYINSDFARVFYKLNFGFRMTIHSLYMLFGGTNWGNLGYPGGYTSYDVGAAISEARLVHREKYSELKLQGGFFQVSPSYITSHPENGTFGVYTDNSDMVVTRLGNKPTNLYIVRNSDVTSLDSLSYRLKVPSSIGDLTIPSLGGRLSLHGRDSKIHVVDYNVGGINLIYSTAEIFTWKMSESKVILVIYGGEDELHEFALPVRLGAHPRVDGKGVKVRKSRSAIIVQWAVRPARRVISFGDRMEVHLLWRNEAYNYWVLDLPAPEPLGLYASPSRADKSVIVKAGYLMRSADIHGEALRLKGDINTTTEIEVVSAPTNIKRLEFNGREIRSSRRAGRLVGIVEYTSPLTKRSIPVLEHLPWRFIDTLPELSSSYNDSKWTLCNQTSTNNPRNLSTPTSLYAGDYGYHSGSLLYRGSFVAEGSESSIYLLTEGGFAYGHSVWLNSTYLGSWTGSPSEMFHNQTLSFPETLQAGKPYVLTVLIDHMGLDLNFAVNIQTMKDPRGILDYDIGRSKSAITWKMTGNLGGEEYRDLSRGPLNEGALYAERQGLHLPGAPVEGWGSRSPVQQGMKHPGVGFFTTTFDLHIPAGYDVPMSLVFTNSTQGHWSAAAPFRCQIFINGWHFGKYVNNIGPQTRYPLPEGILNYDGPNTLGITFWSLSSKPVALGGLRLEADAILQSGYSKPSFVNADRYAPREDAY
ncbi:putative beta-galactosidase [Aspergillus carlsbadensis]|nr:putative beta-galactosidase [Aspergillus carlsbadensis]